MLWTHADEVNKALVDFLDGRPVETDSRKKIAAT